MRVDHTGRERERPGCCHHHQRGWSQARGYHADYQLALSLLFTLSFSLQSVSDQCSPLSLVQEYRYSALIGWSLITELIQKPFNAIKNQLKAPKAPYFSISCFSMLVYGIRVTSMHGKYLLQYMEIVQIEQLRFCNDRFPQHSVLPVVV